MEKGVRVTVERMSKYIFSFKLYIIDACIKMHSIYVIIENIFRITKQMFEHDVNGIFLFIDVLLQNKMKKKVV